MYLLKKKNYRYTLIIYIKEIYRFFFPYIKGLYMKFDKLIIIHINWEIF